MSNVYVSATFKISFKMLFTNFVVEWCNIFQKPRMGTLKDVSLAEAGKWGTLNEYAFFDKVSLFKIKVTCNMN